jgi:hypothetical protein
MEPPQIKRSIQFGRNEVGTDAPSKEHQEALALLILLALGDRDIMLGRYRHATEVFADLNIN